MITPEEEEELIKIGSKDGLVRKLLEEYLSYQEDSSKILFVAFNNGMKKIAQKIENEKLDADDVWFKAMMELGKNGDKFFNTTARGRKDIIGRGGMLADESRSYLDRAADKRKQK